jgi:glycosyltransferase involved in cell wall biosynthesis
MRIILCVTNDIAADRRVDRIALSLIKKPADVLLIGLAFSDSMPLFANKYQTHRIKMFFKKGPLFYAEYNVKLFLRLLFSKADLLVANDLDTLPAVFLTSRIRRLPVVYDSHEYFTELPELVGRKWVKRIWVGLEAFMLPRIKYAYTVSASIAEEYKRKYGINMQVVRNLPNRVTNYPIASISLKKADEKIILYQGSLNRGRGLELAIKAMQFISNVRMVIVGTGYLETQLKELTRFLDLKEKVLFTGRILPDVLQHYTMQADLGISLEEKLGLNYYYALPNKLFDYIQAGVPVLVSDMPEMSQIVNQYGVGRVCRINEPHELALVMGEMLADNEKRQVWKANLKKAAEELCWENEERILIEIYNKVICSLNLK